MRVLFDAYWWGRGPVSNRQVQREIITRWLAEFPEDEVTLVLRHEARAEAVPAGVRVITTRLWPHGVAAVLRYGAIAHRVGADVTITHNFTPLLGRSAVFVHDVMFQTNPEWFTRAERAYFWLITRTLRRADVVLASTRHEAARIARCNPGVTPVPVGLALGTTLTGATPRPPAEALPERFVLCVGRLNVRKNLAFTFRAALASGAVSPERPLVVVGEPQGLATVLEPQVRAAAEAGTIRFLGHVDDAGLAWLYSHAELFVFLTLDEGFGLPPLEALHFGCPVLVSDIGVLRETLGEAATYTDPHDLEAAAQALRRHPGRAAAPAQVPEPSWTQVVRGIRAAVTAAVPA